MNSLHIDYTKVESVISEINTLLSTSEIESAYTQLISQFADSSGEEADALRSLLKAEKGLLNEVKDMLSQFTESVQFAVSEFENLDNKGATAVAEGPMTSIIR
jgi:ElaB/YqjD/DUF883 family membrane-anchored ribosome-binding protein